MHLIDKFTSILEYISEHDEHFDKYCYKNAHIMIQPVCSEMVECIYFIIKSRRPHRFFTKDIVIDESEFVVEYEIDYVNIKSVEFDIILIDVLKQRENNLKYRIKAINELKEKYVDSI